MYSENNQLLIRHAVFEFLVVLVDILEPQNRVRIGRTTNQLMWPTKTWSCSNRTQLQLWSSDPSKTRTHRFGQSSAALIRESTVLIDVCVVFRFCFYFS